MPEWHDGEKDEYREHWVFASVGSKSYCSIVIDDEDKLANPGKYTIERYTIDGNTRRNADSFSDALSEAVDLMHDHERNLYTKND